MYDGFSLSTKQKVIKEFVWIFEKMKKIKKKDEFIRRLSRDLNINEALLYGEIKNLRLSMAHPANSSRSETREQKNSSKKMTTYELLIGFLIEFPMIFEKVKTEISENFFEGELKYVYKDLLDQYNQAGLEGKNFENVVEKMKDELKELASLLGLYVISNHENWSAEQAETEAKMLISSIKAESQRNQGRILLRKIQDAEKQNNFEEVKRLMEEMKKISN